MNHQKRSRLFAKMAKPERRQVRELRALQMINMRLRGHSVVDVAKEFNLSDRQVKIEVNWAKRENLFETARETALALGLKALKVYDKALEVALESGDVEAARDVVFGLGILKKDGSSPAKEDIAQSGTVIATLDQYREHKRLTMVKPTAQLPSAATESDNAERSSAVTYIEAEVFEHVPSGHASGHGAVVALDPLSGGVPTEPVVPISDRYSEGG